MQLLLPALLALPLLQDAEPDAGARIRDYLARLEPFGFSGVCLIERDGALSCAQGFGLANRATGRANGLDTAMPLGSVTKHFTAALVLRLQERGLLSLGARLDELFEDVPEDKRPITVEMLLAHASGLPQTLGEVRAADDAETFVRAALRAELLFPPGAEHSYSNLGYGLLASIAQRAAGKDYASLLREELLEPAGMERTGFERASWGPDQAHGYVDGADEGTLLQSFGGRIPPDRLGSGGLQSTANDMLSWSRALRAGKVLSEASLAAMATPRTRFGPDFAMGWGCGIGEGPLGTWIEHTGSDDVFSAVFRHWLERDLFLFLATNDATVYVEGPLRWIATILAGGAAPDVPRPIALEPVRLAAYAGTWRHGDASVEVEARGDGLVLRSASPRAAGLLWPLPADLLARREALLAAVEDGFRAAYAGDYAPLKELLAPFAPLEDFLLEHGSLLDELAAHHGPFLEARAIPARNRFGEVALLAELVYEHGRQRIEYSFGEREVGSARFVEDLPEHSVLPLSQERFVSYDVERDATWEARFALDASGRPVELVLTDALGEATAFERAAER